MDDENVQSWSCGCWFSCHLGDSGGISKTGRFRYQLLDALPDEVDHQFEGLNRTKWAVAKVS